MMKYAVWFFLFWPLGADAKHLGTFGETFEIVEPDLLEHIEQTIAGLEKDGTLEKHQRTIQQKTQERLQRPLPVKNVVSTQKPRTFEYDPSIEAPFDLKDAKGVVFMKAGTRVNPLDYQAFNQIWLLINGDDAAQVAWALAHREPRKIILVQGAPFALMQTHQTPVYFDQGGSLVNKFKIEQVPARIQQKGNRLLIEELKVEAP